MVNIGGFQKSSLIDYPEKISAIIFTQGCNFRCPYCHNPELLRIINSHISASYLGGEADFQRERKTANVRNSGEGCLNQKRMAGGSLNISNSYKLESQTNTQEIINFLNSRIGKLDGVVITGGEPTLHKDLPDFIKEIKALGFAVKLDTNGTNPNMLSDLMSKSLIDYVAMDIKAPIEKYEEIVCTKVNTENIQKSINILKKSGIEHEFRTTVVKSQLSINDFEKIGMLIKDAPKYYLQRFLPSKTLNENFLDEHTYTDEEFEEILVILKNFVNFVSVR